MVVDEWMTILTDQELRLQSLEPAVSFLVIGEILRCLYAPSMRTLCIAPSSTSYSRLGLFINKARGNPSSSWKLATARSQANRYTIHRRCTGNISGPQATPTCPQLPEGYASGYDLLDHHHRNASAVTSQLISRATPGMLTYSHACAGALRQMRFTHRTYQSQHRSRETSR